MSHDPTERPAGRRTSDLLAAALLAALGVAIAVVQHPLLSKPFWIDETWRAYRLSQPLSAVVRDRSLDMAPMPLGWALVERAVGLPANVEWAWRLPELLSLPALILLTYALARRFLPVTVAALTAAVVGLHPSMLGYSVSLKQYSLDAAVTAGVFLAWHLGEHSRRHWTRTLASVGVCVGVLLSIPVLMVLPALYLMTGIAAVVAARRRRWPEVADAAVATAAVVTVALIHYAWWLRPQGSVAGEWASGFPGHSPGAAASFFLHRTAGWLHVFLSDPDVVPAGSHALVVAAAVVLLAAGLVAAALNSRWREAGAVLVGTFVLMAAASWGQRWPYGYLRTSLFVLPIVYLVLAIGAYTVAGAVALLVRRSSPAHGERSERGLLVLAVVVPAVLIALVASSTLRTAQRQLTTVPDRVSHPGFAFKVRQLVALTRPRATPASAAIVLHPRSIEAWLYYMNDYRGYPTAVAHSRRIGESRTLTPPIEPGRLPRPLGSATVTRFLADRRPDRIFVYAMFLMPQRDIDTALASVESQGYRVTGNWYATVSGRVYELDRRGPAPP